MLLSMLLLHTTTERRATRRRRAVAAGYEHAVARARRPARALTPEIPVARDAVLAQADRMLAIAGLLRSGRELPDTGIRTARRLLTDGGGPLYLGGTAELSWALTRVELALKVR
jgi:hypothetical protein